MNTWYLGKYEAASPPKVVCLASAFVPISKGRAPEAASPPKDERALRRPNWPAALGAVVGLIVVWVGIIFAIDVAITSWIG